MSSAYVPLNERPWGGHRRLLALALAGNPSRALDVGCSSGYLARPLTAAGVEVTGLELDPLAADEARAVCTNVIVGDVETMALPFPNGSFDVVLCADVLEHLRQPGASLARLRPLLCEGGRLVLTTPNVANWAMRLSLLAGRWRYTDRGILDRTHVHFFTRKTLVETLEAAGFRIDVLDHTAPVPVMGSRPVEQAAHAIAGLRPSLFAYQFIVSATPQ